MIILNQQVDHSHNWRLLPYGERMKKLAYYAHAWHHMMLSGRCTFTLVGPA